jgi:CelD/BcsL family acetyltransferase involved in cellulose biosynthesis
LNPPLAKEPEPFAPTVERSASALSLELLTDGVQAERRRADWDALLESCDRNELSQTPDSLLTWWQVYGALQGRQLRLGLFYEQDRLVGLVPLARRLHWYWGCLPFRRLEFLASGEKDGHGIYSNHLNVLAARGHEERVARHFAEALRADAFGAWDELVLPMMDADSPMAAALPGALRQGGCLVTMEGTDAAPYIPLPPTWDAYLKSLSGSHRHLLTRSLRAFDRWAGGQARLERVTGAGNLEKGKCILVDLHHARWERDAQSGVFRSPTFVRFHDLIMSRLLERGCLELSWLSVLGEPVAVLYALAWGGKVHAYQIGRRTDVPANVRPGAVLLAQAIRGAIEAGRREFDMLASESLFKTQLALATRPLICVRAVRPGMAEHTRRVAENCARRLRLLRRVGRSAGGKLQSLFRPSADNVSP